MSRKRPAAGDESTQLNASIPYRVKEKLLDEAGKQGYKSVSAFLTKLLKQSLGME